jgi:hypothetical protein
VFNALLGLGPLERYLADPDVEELLVNGHQQAFVLRSGGTKERVSTGFGSEAELPAGLLRAPRDPTARRCHRSDWRGCETLAGRPTTGPHLRLTSAS